MVDAYNEASKCTDQFVETKIGKMNAGTFFDQLAEATKPSTHLPPELQTEAMDLETRKLVSKAAAFADSAKLSKALVDAECTPKYGDRVEGILGNGKHVIGEYIEKSLVTNDHYVQGHTASMDHFGLYRCVEILQPAMYVGYDELIDVYAKSIGVDPSRIKVIQTSCPA